ncbi:hypothetical protein LINPERHAP1_LOCUS17792 [Linum perenne]
MPTCIYEKLNLGELKPISLQFVLADRYVKTPRGITEDVAVRCGSFTILDDFVSMDTQDVDVVLLVGRSFLATSGVTDVRELTHNNQGRIPRGPLID